MKQKTPLLLITLLAIILLAPYPNPGHPAEQIGPETFSAGNYTFPNQVTIQENFIVNTNTLFVDSTTGRVGVGTTSPEHTLDVNGTARFTGNVLVPTPTSASHAATQGYVDDAVSGLGTGNISGGGSTGQVTYWANADNITGTPTLYWDSGTNQLRIGQAPGTALSLDRSINIGSESLADTVGIRFSVMDGTQNTRAAIRLDADTRELAFDHTWSSGGGIDYVFYRTSTNELVRIQGATGNMGIGTTNPTQKLDVNGSALIQGNLTTTELHLTPQASLPTCDSARRGAFQFEERGVGEDDRIWGCMKNATESYNWVLVARGG